MKTPNATAAAVIAVALAGAPLYAARGGATPKPTTARQHDGAPKSHPPTTRGDHPSKPPHDGSKPHASTIAARIESHPQLASRLRLMLPPGMTLETAASGFKNQGQFIAALHVSKNLGIPFEQLKTEMVTNHHSLGQSIHILKPSADATTEVHRAEREAHDDTHVADH